MKIIISRTDKIGDLILSIPSFFMAKKMYPEAEIILLVRNYNYEIVKNLPYVDRVYKIDDFRQEELLEKIKYFNADIFVALYNDSYIAKLAKASGAEKRIGPISKLSSFFAFNHGVYQKRSKSVKNEADYNLDLIRKIDPERFDELFEKETKIYLEKNHREVAERFFKENNIGEKTLVVNPFMGGSAKNITDDQYVSLLQKIYDRVENLNIIITCHISEEERGQNIINKIGRERVYLFANGGSLLNLAAVIERGKVYFGGSTGPTHIAGSLQKNIVAIYPNKKTQSPTRWGVYNNPNVSYVVPDRPERKMKEDYSHRYFDSYDESVEKEILDLLEEKL